MSAFETIVAPKQYFKVLTGPENKECRKVTKIDEKGDATEYYAIMHGDKYKIELDICFWIANAQQK